MIEALTKAFSKLFITVNMSVEYTKYYSIINKIKQSKAKQITVQLDDKKNCYRPPGKKDSRHDNYL